MAGAAAEYAGYASGADAWALGRFVVPLVRLAELEAAHDALSAAAPGPWRLSALVSDIPADLETIRGFNARHDARLVVDCVEARVSTAAEAGDLAAFARAGIEVFAELPLEEDLERLASAVSAAGAGAKIRTGGTVPEAFPPAADVLRFLRVCHDAGLAFKATAGLHHPVRACFRLTYAADAAAGMMFGYLNVMLAAVLVRLGATDSEVLAMLEERDVTALRFEPAGVRWRERLITADAIRTSRGTFMRSFGSCSFREPLEDLAALAPW
jgi:hypothetical protein